MTTSVGTGVLAVVVFLFSGFILYITRTPAGDLSTAAVALVGPLCGAVGAYYFHSQASQQGATISATGAAAGAAAAAGQSTTINTAAGQTSVTTGVSNAAQ